MERNDQNESVIEIDLLEMAGMLKRKMIWIILAGILFAAAGFAGTRFFMIPRYRSETKMVVLTKENTSIITNSDLQASTFLARDYAELIQSRTVLEAVITNVGLDISYEEMLDKITVTVPEETRIITISVTDENPDMAARIANEIRAAAAEHIQSVMNTEAVNVVDEANIPEAPYLPNTRKNTMIAAAAGILLALCFEIVRFIMDDSIKTPEDVERYLGLSTLGYIPEEADRKKVRKRQKRSKSTV